MNFISPHSIIKTTLEEMKKDHINLLEEFIKFRQQPTSIIRELETRKKLYKQIKGKHYLFSNKYKKKAVMVEQEESPQSRFNQLIRTIKNQTPELGKTYEIPKLAECASKMVQTLIRKIPNQVHFKPQTSSLIRKLLDEDQIVLFPNDVMCLVSVSFNEEHSALASLLIDDDLPERPNRQILLNPKFKYVGVCSAIPPSHEHMKCTVYLLTDKAISRQKIIKQVMQDQNISPLALAGIPMQNSQGPLKQTKSKIFLNEQQIQQIEDTNSQIIRASYNRYSHISQQQPSDRRLGIQNVEQQRIPSFGRNQSSSYHNN